MKIKELVKWIKDNNLDAFAQPINDEFLCQKPNELCNRIFWLTGFTGSFGFAIVTHLRLYFFTDSRYLIQASIELDKKWQIFNIAEKKPWHILTNKNARLGYDPKLFTSSYIKNFDCKLIELSTNPIDSFYKKSNANNLTTKIFYHDKKYSGQSSKEKCKAAAGQIPYFFTDPESICWILNLRGDDDKYTPLFFCRAILYPNGNVSLFIKNQKFAIAKIEEHITLYNTNDLETFLACEQKIATDFIKLSKYFENFFDKNKIIDVKDPCILKRACKNKIEIEGAVNAHKKDGIAVQQFLCWLKKNTNCTEIDASNELLNFRKKQDLFISPSFPTISAFGPNGAIVHYIATEKTDSKITDQNLYLVDSGGQYLDGTTDVTRVLHLGKPTYEQKLHYTIVLKAHIAIILAVFPEGTTGKQLDTLARVNLWKYQLDYGHGTGHGVGSFLNVHEGPQSLGNQIPLQEGMIISCEPGIYIKGKYGIRLENLIYVARLSDKFLHFKVLTLVPFEEKLIDQDLLTKEENDWLNWYNKKSLSLLN